MGMILFYLVVCGVAWYAGGSNLAELAAIIITILWVISAIGNRHMQAETTAADRARHKQDGAGHVYYQKDGKTIHESDGCAGCMANRAEELRRQGYSIEHIPGRHNSGDL
jgi:hypothetical protein